ncbi:uncharacterized protein LOC9637080 isoform X2 [Selaginella moellendorffii]|nr:uncharacterized protein LOC9637080 isoform X2 [Selaginella moellendorffii]|eukprot:XP_002994044.2 uncharacterized protein LOC9637080 isoform X2 [Selaginella moellendorffii]
MNLLEWGAARDPASWQASSPPFLTSSPPWPGVDLQSPHLDLRWPTATHPALTSVLSLQILSSRLTEPSVRFGRGCRIGMEKLYIDAEISKLTPGLSPGMKSCMPIAHHLMIAFVETGPAYELVPSIGKQVKSDYQNPAEVAFPLARRFTKFKGGDAPGPGAYEKASSFGDQVLSYQKSPEKAVIGSATRKQQQKVYLSQDFNKSLYGIESPGPVVCDLRSSIGDQMHSENRNAPHIKFPMDKRFKHGKISAITATPGAGEYKCVAAIGKQPQSSRLNQPVISFTHSRREQREKIFISVEHERGNVGLESPGPAVNIKLISSLGQQPNSKKVSPPSYSFSGAKRFKRVYETLPGPGEYDC